MFSIPVNNKLIMFQQWIGVTYDTFVPNTLKNKSQQGDGWSDKAQL